VKTYADWTKSRLDLSHFLQPGDAIDDAMFDYFLGVLPPKTSRTDLLQMGEPYDHVQGRPTYSTLHKVEGRWIYAGHCHAAECNEPEFAS
jgi:hypothetical protein